VRRLEIVRAINEVRGDANGEAFAFAAEFEMAGELHETGQGGAARKDGVAMQSGSGED